MREANFGNITIYAIESSRFSLSKRSFIQGCIVCTARLILVCMKEGYTSIHKYLYHVIWSSDFIDDIDEMLHKGKFHIDYRTFNIKHLDCFIFLQVTSKIARIANVPSTMDKK